MDGDWECAEGDETPDWDLFAVGEFWSLSMASSSLILFSNFS